MEWQTISGRTVSWNPGEPWPTQNPEEITMTLAQLNAKERGGYYCRDGDHYTFASFVSWACCTYCDLAVAQYYDSQIWF